MFCAIATESEVKDCEDALPFRDSDRTTPILVDFHNCEKQNAERGRSSGIFNLKECCLLPHVSDERLDWPQHIV